VTLIVYSNVRIVTLNNTSG